MLARRTGTIESLLVSQVPLGVLPGREFTAEETTYAAGDLFLVLTDGLTEVFDRADREFGIEGVQAVLPRTRGRRCRKWSKRC